MSSQCMDLGLSRAELERRLVDIGYWGDAERLQRNAYVLSPSAYVVGPRQQVALDTLAKSLYASIERVSDRLSLLARSTRKTHAEAHFVSSVKNCIKRLRAPHEHDGTIPPVIKVDLMQATDGRFFIAEADTYNPRGFGYLALMEALLPEGVRYVGTGIAGLAEKIRACTRGELLDVVVSEYEHYYLPSYQILAQSLNALGVPTRLSKETDLARSRTLLGALRSVLILPDSLYAAPFVRDDLLSRIRNGSLVSVYPPAAYLGSKALLPTLGECAIVRRFLPTTLLVSRRDSRGFTLNGTSMLLKGTGSSGHKNIVFSRREPDRFAQVLEEAFSFRNPHWILQEEVEQARIPVVVFDADGRRLVREYAIRLTAYIAREGLLGLEMTGREDGFVHGAPDCIQIPCILP